MKTSLFNVVAASALPEDTKALKPASVGASIIRAIKKADSTLSDIGAGFDKAHLQENRALPKADQYANDKAAYLDGYLTYLVSKGYLVKSYADEEESSES